MKHSGYVFSVALGLLAITTLCAPAFSKPGNRAPAQLSRGHRPGPRHADQVPRPGTPGNQASPALQQPGSGTVPSSPKGRPLILRAIASTSPQTSGRAEVGGIRNPNDASITPADLDTRTVGGRDRGSTTLASGNSIVINPIRSDRRAYDPSTGEPKVVRARMPLPLVTGGGMAGNNGGMGGMAGMAGNNGGMGGNTRCRRTTGGGAMGGDTTGGGATSGGDVATPASSGPATEPGPAAAATEQPQKAPPQAEPDAGVEAADRLTDRDEADRVRQGSFAKVYTVRLKGGQSYVIDLESPGGGEWFDPYLRVEDERGKVLAEDNDSGGRMNACLTFRPTQDGEYRLVVTSFRPKATGAFFLRVR